ncbi:hypothetical protein QZH45_13680 [Pseudomonas corrugata]|uniref:Uncharacterized protein n=2 Tax=Pseudomonas TaxID=286 RepID=A0A3M3EBH2_9PSED|nr:MULTISPECIES: hypothetical protein [Pseudomonas]AOE60333.1 hypothetical protein AXG94_00560 [Pseudomonas corrugata]KPW92365.1 hypothetical protein ALO79_200372 [Pseudomonas syringae pv. castaneae]RMM46950.1 hypothetical protein ALQ77_00717 [Pseudomonas corrugata]SDU95517.1 hypothetical protein SAMN04490183_2168 [Pseudomonas corrugata]
MVSASTLKALAAGAVGVLGVGAWVWQSLEGDRKGQARKHRPPETSPHLSAARRLNRGAGILALSVAADSALEHYRADFHNRAMYTPLVASTLAFLASAHGLQDRSATAHRVRDSIYGAVVLTGLAGTAFHVYNVTRKTGGLSLDNLFYAAPLGAPAALILSGLLGSYGERVRDAASDRLPTVFGLPAGEAVALLTVAGLLGTTAEAALLHLRGSFQNPAMYLPVTLPPAVAALLTATVVEGDSRPRLRWFSRLGLRMTALLGIIGACFHGFGVHRNFGGWKNWRQNLQAGPPIPAPPSFTGLALAGLAAHRLLDAEAHMKQRGGA